MHPEHPTKIGLPEFDRSDQGRPRAASSEPPTLSEETLSGGCRGFDGIGWWVEAVEAHAEVS